MSQSADYEARLLAAFDRGEPLAGPDGVVAKLLAEAWREGYDKRDTEPEAHYYPEGNPYLRTRPIPPGDSDA